MAEFTPERIEKIREALIAAGYREETISDGKVFLYAHFDDDGEQDSDGCMLPAHGRVTADLPNRAAECIQSLIRLTGDQHLELGPLTPREEAYAKVIDDAPHEEDCDYIDSVRAKILRVPSRIERPCDCWKSRALKSQPTESAGTKQDAKNGRQ